jgi:hypothetical protein
VKEERFHMEKIRLKNMANKKEYEEILRRYVIVIIIGTFGRVKLMECNVTYFL